MRRFDPMANELPLPDAELVRVFTTGDQGLIAIAKSLLEAEAIDFFVRGDGLQNLFGYGVISGGFNFIVGPAEFWVREEDAERALDVLQGLGEPPAPTAEG